MRQPKKKNRKKKWHLNCNSLDHLSWSSLTLAGFFFKQKLAASQADITPSPTKKSSNARGFHGYLLVYLPTPSERGPSYQYHENELQMALGRQSAPNNGVTKAK